MPKKTNFPVPDDVLYALRRVGENLGVARKRRRWTQQNVADRLGVSREVVRSIESGSSASSANLLSMLWLYGFLDGTLKKTDPDQDAVGLSLEIERLPKAVRNRDDF